ncbi:MAG: hypothetical protein APF81_14725 [Desulfosporosinus sp. BRH_c37]|nr:MAG: hypothetical protein APF81_14725 [Desulfosporosinus sp. BRH_c37]
MSVLVAIMANPTQEQKPYFLMGSDSKKVNAVPIFNKDNEVIDYEIVSTDEDAEYIFEINDKLIGMAGYYDFELTKCFIKFLQENDREIDDLAELAFIYLKDKIHNEKLLPKSRCVVIIGCCNNSKPKLAYIVADKINSRSEGNQVVEPKEGECYPLFFGNSSISKDLEEKFIEGVKGYINYNLPSVKKTAIEYLKAAAARYPETCNQKIKIKYLR